jgi:hypothetical protein
MTLQKISAKNEFGYQNTQNFMLIRNSLMPAYKNARKIVICQIFVNFEYFLHLLQSIFAFNFFSQLFLKLLSTKKISIYSNSAFVDIHIHFFTILRLTLALFAQKTAYFQTFAKFNTFLPRSSILRVISSEIPKSFKIGAS